MRILNHYLLLSVVSILLFHSCSKEDLTNNLDENTATLSFGAILNDFISNKAAVKGHLDNLPACSNEVPATVQVALMDEEGNWVAGEEGSVHKFIEIPVNETPDNTNAGGTGIWFTKESSNLELAPGVYTIEYFAVLDRNRNVLWLAPRSNEEYGNASFQGYVRDALPLNISLGKGVKKYVTIEVLCFDDRFVNEYGYMFFDINTTEIISFCVFGNICDENGRHAPANFRVDVWTYSGDPANPKGTPLFNENDPYVNQIEVAPDGGVYAAPVCVFLPDTAGDDDYYGEIILIENGESQIIRSGRFTDAIVRGLYNDDMETTEFFHFREGCGEADSPNIFNTVEDPVIDIHTNINIYFDSSGSMDSTLEPLNVMRATCLKEALLPLYENDENAYDEKVRVISNPTEQTMNFLNFENETPEGKMISLVFQDEAATVYTNGSSSWDDHSPRTSAFDEDISTLRARLDTFQPNDYRAIIFQVHTGDNFYEFFNFKKLIQYVQTGSGNYSGNYGLSDREEFNYKYDVTPGATPEYYKELIVEALQELGYQL